MKRTSLYLCFVAAALVLFASCARTQAPSVLPKVPNVVPITIHLENKQIMVDPRVASLRRAYKQQARWQIAPPDLQFKVRFDKPQGSPFAQAEFDNTNNISGPIVVPPSSDGSDQYFPYTVEVEGYDSIDPGVIIW